MLMGRFDGPAERGTRRLGVSRNRTRLGLEDLRDDRNPSANPRQRFPDVD